jgi:hypothetical protein
MVALIASRRLRPGQKHCPKASLLIVANHKKAYINKITHAGDHWQLFGDAPSGQPHLGLHDNCEV